MIQNRKSAAKPRDSSTAHGSTTAESVKNLIKKNPKYSKRINYDALKDLFVDGDMSAFGPPVDLEAKEDTMFTMDDKFDGEVLIIEEEPGTVASAPPPAKESTATGLEDDMDWDPDGAGDADAVGDWEDAYEQEV